MTQPTSTDTRLSTGLDARLSSGVDAVVFDFGNVVVQWSMRALFSEFFHTDAAVDEFLSTVLTPAENLRCDLGTPLADVVSELVDRHPHHEAPLLAWRDRWIETIPGMVDGTEALIDDLLAAGHRVLGLSNFSTETFALTLERYPVFHKFDDYVLSGAVGMAKPDPRIYELLLERHELEAHRCVFLDDSLANVEAATALGIRSHHFTTAATARRWLIDDIGVVGLGGIDGLGGLGGAA